MPELANPRHEAWAFAVAIGKKSDVQAYVEAYQSSYDTAQSNACRLRENAGIVERINELIQPARQELVLSRQEALEFLTKGIRTAPGDVDEHSPLCQEYQKDGDGNVKVKMVSKLDSLQIAGKMQGWFVEKSEHTLKLSIYHAGEEKPVIDV
jgi:hypothetical protein